MVPKKISDIATHILVKLHFRSTEIYQRLSLGVWVSAWVGV